MSSTVMLTVLTVMLTVTVPVMVTVTVLWVIARSYPAWELLDNAVYCLAAHLNIYHNK